MADPLIISAAIAAGATVVASGVGAVAAVRSNKQLRPSNGTTLATMIERTDGRVEAVEAYVRKVSTALAHHLAVDHGIGQEERN